MLAFCLAIVTQIQADFGHFVALLVPSSHFRSLFAACSWLGAQGHGIFPVRQHRRPVGSGPGTTKRVRVWHEESVLRSATQGRLIRFRVSQLPLVALAPFLAGPAVQLR